MDKPSDIVRLYLCAAKAAARMRQTYELDAKRLRGMFSETQINGIIACIHYANELENQLKAKLEAIDKITN